MSKAKSKKAVGSVRLGANSYGKSRVRVMKVRRDKSSGRHDVWDLSVDVALEGDFDAIHLDGDNALCLPTDTMKNTVYALAKDDAMTSIEAFAARLAMRFVSRNAHVSAARVTIGAVPWRRVEVNGRPHAHAFEHGGGTRQTCRVETRRDGRRVTTHHAGGVEGWIVMKTTDSAFSGYLKDEYTTLSETRDRVFCTSVTADWHFTDAVNFARVRDRVMAAMLKTFAGHKSESVQQTLYAMGDSALRAEPAIDRIRLSLPNKHCLLVNLRPFGMENANEIFVPTDEPHGLIEAEVLRGRTRT